VSDRPEATDSIDNEVRKVFELITEIIYRMSHEEVRDNGLCVVEGRYKPSLSGVSRR
jgi:hypothetical protein